MNSNVLQKDIKKYIYIRLIIEVNFIPTNGSPLIPKKKKKWRWSQRMVTVETRVSCKKPISQAVQLH